MLGTAPLVASVRPGPLLSPTAQRAAEHTEGEHASFAATSGPHPTDHPQPVSRYTTENRNATAEPDSPTQAKAMTGKTLRAIPHRNDIEYRSAAVAVADIMDQATKRSADWSGGLESGSSVFSP